MKRTLALLLSIVMLLSLFAACDKKTADEHEGHNHDEPSESLPADENAIAYKDLASSSFDVDAMKTAEGREPDATTEIADGTPLYIYNNVAYLDFTFTQVQYTFSDTRNKISCTISTDDPATTQKDLKDSVTELYGEPSESTTSSDASVYTWRETGSKNYITLMQLNADTVQLAFNFDK
ncbi:MAG: hypothetical protein LBM28_01445 [Oscillospiraceae bacterium]|jgi:hypothetical protein|nr:hypothetical protein [Oscillospiraceae bacterium]